MLLLPHMATAFARMNLNDRVYDTLKLRLIRRESARARR